MIHRPYLRLLSILAIASSVECFTCNTIFAQNPEPIAQFSTKEIAADYEVLLKEVSYTGLPDLVTNSSSQETKQGAALLVARTQLKDVPEEMLNKLAEQLAANNRNPAFSLVTLSDLQGTSNEAKAATAARGSLLDFSNNQTVLNTAVARGLAMVLFVDLTHFNSKPSTVSGANGLNLVNARASLTLLNAADGVRMKSFDRDVKTRGFDPRDLTDKAFDLLSKELSAETSRWKLPELQIKLIQLEVHAKFDGIQFPMIDLEEGSGSIQLKQVPVFAEGASVEIDGVLKGRAPCRVDVAPGTHKLRVYREGAKSFEATIQVNSNNRFDALLTPDEEFRRRFDEQLAKFERVKTMALERNVRMEQEGVRTDGMRVANENSRKMGNAASDLVQSKADIGRVRANARAEVDIARAGAITQDAGTRAELGSAESESIRKNATGNLAVAQSKADVARVRGDSGAEIDRANAGAITKDAGTRGEIGSAESEAIRKGATGKLALDNANARDNAPIINERNKLLKAQAEAFKSFAENIGKFSVKLATSGR